MARPSNGGSPPAVLAGRIGLAPQRRRPVVAVLACTAVALAVFHEAVFLGRVLYLRDLHLQWAGQLEMFVRTVVAGSWPVWDPSVGFGQPFLANANNQILYPPTWLNFLMRPWTYFTLYATGHVAFAGLGGYALARRYGASHPAALSGAAVWAASGPLLSSVNLWNHFAAAAWMPWSLAAADAALRRPRLRAALAWAVTLAAQIVTGSPDLLLMTLLATVAFAVPSLRLRHGGRRAAGQAGAALLAGVLALGLSAAQWMPSLELARHSPRATLPMHQRTFWSVHPAVALAQTILPIDILRIPLSEEVADTYFDGREPLLLALYLGLPSLALAAAGLTPGARFRRRLPAVAVLVAATVMALGRFTPLYEAVVTVVPGAGMLRFPVKAMLPAALAYSLLVAAGVDQLRRGRSGRARHVAIGVLAAGAGVAAIALYLTTWGANLTGDLLLFRNPQGLPDRETLRPLAGRVGVTLTVTLLSLAVALARHGRPLAVLGLLCTIDLVAVHARLNPVAPQSLYTYRPEPLAVIPPDPMQRLFVYDYRHVPGSSPRYLGRSTPFMLPGVRRQAPAHWLEALAGRTYLTAPIPSAWGRYGSFDPDLLSIHPAYLTQLRWLLHATELTPAFSRLLRMGAVHRVVSLHRAGLESLPPLGIYPSMFVDPVSVHAVPDPQPRVYVVTGARIAAGTEALRMLRDDPTFDVRTEIVLPAGIPRAAGPTTGTARILELRPDRIRMEVDMPTDGWVTTVDAWDPGWRARVDGRPSAVERANVAFRAVAVPAGTHVVEMEYWPATLTLGLLLSTASLLGLVGLVAVAARPKERAAGGNPGAAHGV